MFKTDFRHPRWKEVAAYLIVLGLCFWIMERILRLRKCDLSVLFSYGGDALPYSMVIKAILTKGWYLSNDSLGLPGVMEMYYFPMPSPDNFHFLLIKLCGLFTSDFAVVHNLFFLLTFPLITLCSFYVLRQFGVSYAPAALASLLYTFENYHFWRGESHLMLSAYYMIPLTALLLLRICSGELIWPRLIRGQIKSALLDRKLLGGLLIGLVIALTAGAYYGFFAAALFFSAGLYAWFNQRTIRGMILPGVLVAMIFGVLLINVIPNLRYASQHGKAEVSKRGPGEAELYGMKIAQLLMPIHDHRLRGFARIKEHYNTSTPLSNENGSASLGLIGAAGFLTLIGWLLYRKDAAGRTRTLLGHLSILNGSAVLIATVGGFSSIFSQAVSPQIRSFNRMSIFIAFFSLFAVALLLDVAFRRYFQTPGRRIVYYALIVVLIVLGVLDQTHKRMIPDQVATKAEYLNDQEFIHRIEAAMPPRAMIFQLPLSTFPEGRSEPFVGYLHSKALRWSFGAIRGRDADVWQQQAVAKPAREMLVMLAGAGFSGIFIERKAYPDYGLQTETELSTQLGALPIVSGNQHLSFFSLLEYQQKFKNKGSEAD
ncbi:MAG TPA: hypothetical protein VJ302_29705, partial [Blastocatellia bacterium]|nr:hypothetical protein [Blastocatellia bacterium]